MSDALERVLLVAEHLGEVADEWAFDLSQHRESIAADLRAVCAELTALRGARSWERWAVVDADDRPWVAVSGDAFMPGNLDDGERVIRVRITEIPEDGQ